MVAKPLPGEVFYFLLGFAGEYEDIALHRFGVFGVGYFDEVPVVYLVLGDETCGLVDECEGVVEHAVDEGCFAGGTGDTNDHIKSIRKYK